MHQRIGKYSGGLMDNAPVGLAGHRVLVLAAQKSDVVSVLQLVHRSGPAPELHIEPPDGQRVLLASVDEQLFALAGALEHNARQLVVKRDGNCRRQHEHEQKCIPGFAAMAAGIAHRRRPHPLSFSSSTSGSGCWFLYWMSSTSAEFTPICTMR